MKPVSKKVFVQPTLGEEASLADITLTLVSGAEDAPVET